MSVEFELPEELQGLNYDKILAAMLNEVPNRYDKMEGGFVFDMIAPSALECAELVTFWLPLALRTNYYFWATGRWLDYHAENCGLTRRPATPAYGDLTITTTKPVTFPAGFLFCVPSDDDNPSRDFELIEATTIDGTATVRIRAVEAGTDSNVAADSIVIMKNPVKNVALITNDAPLTGGTAAESDDSLRGRIRDFYAGRGNSFVGNKKDYMRWAKMVAGVGFVNVIPCYAGPNTVKIVLSDSNGDAATAELCAEVEKYIFGESHDDLERLAPIGVVSWEVAPPTPKTINISIEPTLSLDAELVKKNIRADLTSYFKTLSDAENVFGTLFYVKVSSVLTAVDGLEDFKHLRINGGLNNISFNQDEMPQVGEITFTD